MCRGYNRRAGEVIASSRAPSSRVFCYHYETGFGRRHVPRDLIVAVVETDTEWPGVWIGRGSGLDCVGAFGRYRLMEAEATGQADEASDEPERASPAPARPLKTYAESSRLVEAHAASGLVEVLRRGQGERTCELRGPYVALYEEGVGGAPSQIELLAQAESLADRICKTSAENHGARRPSPRGGGRDSPAPPDGAGVP